MDGQSSRPNSVPPEGSAPALRKRRRPALACENCRMRKIKCDRKTPCNKCIRGKRAQTCSYVPEGDASAVKTRPSRPSPAKQQPTPQSRDGSVTHVAASNPRTRVVEQGLLQEAVEKIGSNARSQLPVESTPLSQTHVPQPASLLGPDSDLPLRETYVKGKLFGASHWTNAVDHLPNMLRLHRYDSARYPQIRELLCQCKRYARQAKRHPPSFEATSAELRNKLPPREVADQLLNRYLDTFEAVFRLHHPPSFRQEYEEYWLNPSAARDSFVVKLLLVLALGTCFDDLDSPESWYATSLQWIVAAHAWVNSPFNKRRSSLVEVQIQCLLLLARQTHAIGGDMIWTSAGTLHRTAMQIGLNRDPSHLPVKSPVELEVRKRVWATTLELLVQSSIDAGQPPLISVDDFDCGAPSDSDDLECQNSSSADWGTQKSAQNILLDSLPVRLEIAKFLNHFRSDLSYSAALELSTRLAKSIRIQAGSFSNKSESGVFQCKLVEFLTHRFIIVLHQAFAAKAKNSPTFYFSRKMCSDASLLILTATQSGQSSNYFNKLMSLGNGIFHITFLQAAAFLVLEQTIQQDEASSYSSLVTQSSLLSQQEQRQALRFYCNSLRSKLKRGQANFKAYVFLECAVTQLEDTADSTENERISQLEIVLRECAHILGQSVGSVGSAETSNSQGATPSQQTSDIGDFVFDMSNFPYDLEGPNAVPLPDSLFVDPMYWPFQE